ncbi:MAG: hypothetical protein RL557_422 [archaeon]|jgi:hypothetical protein
MIASLERHYMGVERNKYSNERGEMLYLYRNLQRLSDRWYFEVDTEKKKSLSEKVHVVTAQIKRVWRARK